MNRSDAPLSGVTVVERTQSVAGAYAGRLFSALGADTILVEPPEGNRLRAQPPLLPSGDSSIFTYLAAGKRSVSLDLRDHASRAELGEMIAGTDVYVDDFPLEERRLSGAAARELCTVNPTLVYVSVRPFGAIGPKAGWAGEEVTLMHSTGEGYLLPNGLAYQRHPDRPPIKIFGHFAEMQGGIAAVLGALASLASGTGQIIDVSVQDAVVALAAFGTQRFGDGSVEHRSTRSFKYGGVLECSDGFIELLTLEDRQWQSLVTMLGGPAWATDPALADGVGRGLHGDEINKELRAWAITQKSADLVAVAQQLGVPAAKYATPLEVLGDPHEVARGLFQRVIVPGIGEMPILTAPFQLDGGPLQLAGGPPEWMPTATRATASETGIGR